MRACLNSSIIGASQSVRTLYRSLEAIVFNHYVRTKTLSLNALIKHGMVGSASRVLFFVAACSIRSVHWLILRLFFLCSL